MHRISAIFHRVSQDVKTKVMNFSGTLANIFSALVQPAAMKAEQRHIDEFKLMAGTVITGAGVAEANPLVAAGGAIPVWEAMHDLDNAGKRWRTHKQHKAHI